MCKAVTCYIHLYLLIGQLTAFPVVNFIRSCILDEKVSISDWRSRLLRGILICPESAGQYNADMTKDSALQLNLVEVYSNCRTRGLEEKRESGEIKKDGHG